MRNGYRDTGYNIKLYGMVQEILVTDGFSKLGFSVFLLAYGCFAIIPNIRKRADEGL